MLNQKSKLRNSIICVLVVFVVLALSSVGLLAYKGATITETLNIAAARKNMEGPGYQWANRYNELTLNGVNIDTTDAYGLRLPKDCTVILKGNNYIKAANYGVSCSGTVAFKGNGTLVIDAGIAGIYLISQNNTHKIRLIEGDYVINAGENGVLSEYADFSFVGDSMCINVENENGYAVNGRCVNLLGGTFEANAPVVTSHELVVDGLDIEIAANRSALASPSLKVDNIKFDGIDSYNGESSIIGTALKRFHAKSIVFGEDFPGWIDYILLVLFAALVIVLIVVPTLRKKRKARQVLEQLKSEGLITD